MSVFLLYANDVMCQDKVGEIALIFAATGAVREGRLDGD